MPKKWDSDSTPTEKALLLFGLLLFNNRPYSLKELAGGNCLNASKATVLRLLERLASAKIIPLRMEKRGRENYYWLERPQRRLPDFALDADGLFQLAMCRDFIAHLLPEGMREQTLACIVRAADYLPQACQSLPPAIAASLCKGAIDYTPFQNIFESLARAASSRLVCRVEYRPASGAGPRAFDFAPLRLLAYRECVYVDGWELDAEDPGVPRHDDPLRLALQRFAACSLTERSSGRLPPLPEDSGAMGVMPSWPEDEFEIVARFERQAAAYVADRQWSHGQEICRNPEDGSITLRATMANASETIVWLLGFGDCATLLEPDWLVKMLADTLRKTLRKYRAKRDQGIS